MEQIKNLPKYLPQYMPRTTDMCVNTEWPGFFSHSLPILNEDQELDAESHHPGQHCFEKLTAGLYLGDVARRILLRYPPSRFPMGADPFMFRFPIVWWPFPYLPAVLGIWSSSGPALLGDIWAM